MGKSTISMAIFNSYVKLPEGIPSWMCFSKHRWVDQLFIMTSASMRISDALWYWDILHPTLSMKLGSYVVSPRAGRVSSMRQCGWCYSTRWGPQTTSWRTQNITFRGASTALSDLPSGNDNSLLLKMTIYSGFTHWTCSFSIVMLVYQRV